MLTRYFISLAAILLAFASCKKDARNPDFEDKPVIESYLKVGDTATVKVSKLVAFASDAQYSSENIDALHVSISANGITYLLQDQGGGVYKAINPLLIVNAAYSYSLALPYNGKNVSATTGIPTKPTGYTQSVNTLTITQITTAGPQTSGSFQIPDPVKLTWTNCDNSYYLIVVENAETNPEAINTTETTPPRIFKNSPIQTNTYEIRSRQFHYYGLHRLILYHLNADYAALYTDNNNNSNNLSNSQTSVVNGAGIFTGIHSDTLYLTVKKP